MRMTRAAIDPAIVAIRPTILSAWRPLVLALAWSLEPVVKVMHAKKHAPSAIGIIHTIAQRPLF
jgi:hypothetical protein